MRPNHFFLALFLIYSKSFYFRVCTFDWSEFLRDELIDLAMEYRQMEDGLNKQQYR